MTNKHFQDLGDGIYHLDAEYMSPGVASVYLIIQDGECAIIETGTNHTVPRIFAALEQLGLNQSCVRFVIPTHVHLDHAGGVGELMAQCPNAELVIHPLGARHMINPAKLISGASAVYGEAAFKRLYGELKPVDPAQVTEALDGFELSLAGRTLRFYDTPGHARHHFCVHDLNSQTIFTGDTFGISYPSLNTPHGPLMFATTTPVQFDPDALHRSIETLMAVKPRAMNLTHFGRITPDRSVVEQLTGSIEHYLKICQRLSGETEQRCQKIESSIFDYLLNNYRQLGGVKSDSEVREILAMDCKLNAQGLDFWLSNQDR